MEGRNESVTIIRNLLIFLTCCWLQVHVSVQRAITIEYTGTSSIYLTVGLDYGETPDLTKLSWLDRSNGQPGFVANSTWNLFRVAGLAPKTCYDFFYDQFLSCMVVSTTKACTYALVQSNVQTESFDIGVKDTTTVTQQTAKYRPLNEGSVLTRTGTGSTVTLDKLSPGEKVAVTVVVTLPSLTLDYLAGEFCSKPQRPTVGNISSISSTSFNIASVSVTQGYATTFKIEVNCEGNQQFIKTIDSSDSQKSINAAGLLAGCNHQIITDAECKDRNNSVVPIVRSDSIIVNQCTKPENLIQQDITIGATVKNHITFDGLKVASGMGKLQASVAVLGDQPNCEAKTSYVVSGVNLLTTATSATIVGLNAGCPYSFTLQPVCTSLDESISETSADSYTVDQCTTPSDVATVVFSETENSIAITSATVTEGSYYDIIARPTEVCNSNVQLQEKYVSGDAEVFDNLKSGCLYSFHLAARCTTKENPTQSELSQFLEGPASVVKLCTRPQQPTLGTISNVALFTFDIESISVLQGYANSFKIEVKCGNDQNFVKEVASGDSQAILNVAGLTAGCYHEITAQAECTDESDSSVAIVKSEINIMNQCTKPENLIQQDITIGATVKNHITFDGLKVASGMGKLQASVAVLGDQPNCEAKTSYVVSGVNLLTTATSATIVGLNAGCPYSFTLQPVCTSLDESISETSADSYTVDQCTTPSDVATVVFSETENSIAITSATVTEGSYYDIIARPTEVCNSNVQLQEKYVSGGAEVFDNLKSGCLYSFHLAARCTTKENPTQSELSQFLEGPASVVKLCTKPQRPTLGTISNIASTSFNIESVSVTQGHATAFKIEVKCGDDQRFIKTVASADSQKIITVDGLVPGCKHEILTIAECIEDNADQNRSVTSDINITYQCTEPLPPSNLSMLAGTATVASMILTLEPPSELGGNPNSSVIIKSRCGTSNTATEHTCSSGSNCAISKLDTPGCSYTFEAVSRCHVDANNFIDSSKSASASFCTKPQELSKNDVIAGPPTETEIYFTGLRVTGGLGKLQARATSTTPNCTDRVSYIIEGVSLFETTTSATIDGLSPGCLYSVTLQPVCVGAADTTVVTTSDKNYTTTLCTRPAPISEVAFAQASTNSLTLIEVILSGSHGSGSYVDILASQIESCSDRGDVTTVDQIVTNTPHEFTFLKPGCLYSFSLAPRCTDGSNFVSATAKTVQKCTKPEEPILGEISSIGETNLEIESISVPQNTYASSYKIIFSCGSIEVETKNVQSVDATRAIRMTSLIAGCNHTITTEALCGDGNNSYSRSDRDVKYQCTKPKAFSSFRIVSKTSASIEIGSIAMSSGEYLAYSILIESSDEADSFTLTIPNLQKATNVTAHNITGLRPITKYDVTLTAFCGDEVGEAKKLTRILTRPLPAEVIISKKTSNGCKLSFSAPSDDASKYKIAFSMSSDSSFESFESLDGLTEKFFSNLLASTDYTFYSKLQYNPENGSSVESDVTSVVCRTGPAEFTSVEIEETGSVFMKLKAVYNKPVTEPERLRIVAEIVAADGSVTEAAYKDGSSKSTCRETDNPQSCSNGYEVERIIVGLDPSTKYTIRITAQYDGTRTNPNTVQIATTAGCMLTDIDNQCVLPSGSSNQPQNYRCRAGYAPIPVEGTCGALPLGYFETPISNKKSEV